VASSSPDESCDYHSDRSWGRIGRPLAFCSSVFDRSEQSDLSTHLAAETSDRSVRSTVRMRITVSIVRRNRTQFFELAMHHIAVEPRKPPCYDPIQFERAL